MIVRADFSEGKSWRAVTDCEVLNEVSYASSGPTIPLLLLAG